MGKCTVPLASATLVMWLPASASAQGDQRAQIEKGRLVVAQACTTCHTTLGRMLQVHKQTPAQWTELVHFMISRGAQVMPDEIEPVAAFLATTAGRGTAQGGGAEPQGGGGRGRNQGK